MTKVKVENLTKIFGKKQQQQVALQMVKEKKI